MILYFFNPLIYVFKGGLFVKIEADKSRLCISIVKPAHWAIGFWPCSVPYLQSAHLLVWEPCVDFNPISANSRTFICELSVSCSMQKASFADCYVTDHYSLVNWIGWILHLIHYNLYLFIILIMGIMRFLDNSFWWSLIFWPISKLIAVSNVSAFISTLFNQLHHVVPELIKIDISVLFLIDLFK